MGDTMLKPNEITDILRDINEDLTQTLARFGPDFEPLDIPPQTRSILMELGIPVGFPFPVHRIGVHWALIKVPAGRWKRIRAQFKTPEEYETRPGGEDARFHLLPLTKASRSVVLYAIFPGGQGYCPGEIVVDPTAEGRKEENPAGLRFIEVSDPESLLARHEEVAVDFDRDASRGKPFV